MQGWVRSFIKKQHTLSSDSSTLAVDLPENGALSSLLVKLAWTNGSTDSAMQDVIDAVDKIAVVANGSHEIFSMSGEELARKCYFDFARRMPQKRDFSPNVVQTAVFPVLFGRYPADPNYFLRCGDFSSLELKITYSPTISATVGFVTGTGVLDVIALNYIEGEPGVWLGYFRTTTQRDTTTLASGDEVVDLPRANDYRRIGVYCYEASIEDGVDVTELELSLNNGASIPYAARFVDAQEDNALELGVNSDEEGVFSGVGAESFNTRVGRIQSIEFNPVFTYTATTDFPSALLQAVAGPTVTVGLQLNEGTGTWAAAAVDTVQRSVHWRARGIGVGQAVVIPFDRGGDMDRLLKSADLSSVKLTATQGGAGGALKVWLEELVRM